MPTMLSRYLEVELRDLEVRLHLGGDPVPPKLFLAPAKDGGAPPDVDGTGGAAA
eukprot:COSAG01_NODE_54325_length_332_cov_9.433476_1_plen_53_part_01